jgi:hypothetical protein
MAKSPVAGQPAITRAGCYDSEAAKQMQDVTCNGVTTSYTGSTDALAFPGNAAIDSTGVNAMTLATPKAGQQPAGDDGKTVYVVDTGGHAHTITTAANKIAPSHDTATFNGTAGSNVTLRAYNGLWYPVGTSLGVSFSEV